MYTLEYSYKMGKNKKASFKYNIRSNFPSITALTYSKRNKNLKVIPHSISFISFYFLRRN